MSTAPLKLLRPDPENPRGIDAEALAGLGVSVAQFGDLSSVVFNEQLGLLVAGHQRVKALEAAGATAFEREEGSDTGWIAHPETGERFRIRFVRWDLPRHRMANLVANSSEISGHYTEAALDQIKALEDEVGFEALRMGELEEAIADEIARVERDVAREKREQEREADDGQPTSGNRFDILVECRDAAHRRELSAKFQADGLGWSFVENWKARVKVK